jgi:hypothetical protein
MNLRAIEANKCKATVTIKKEPAEYRYLEPNEMMEQGDEYQVNEDDMNTWSRVAFPVGRKAGIFLPRKVRRENGWKRRKHYRYLDSDEIMCEGDQYQSYEGAKWVNVTGAIGKKAGVFKRAGVGRVRRPV